MCALALALCAPAAAATRSWVSGTGDDANPCSRTAPCQTFNGASTKTTAGGEIDVLDAGEFGPDGNSSGTGATSGPVSITQAVTIAAPGIPAAVYPAGATDAIDINAPGALVILNGLDINGQGIGLDGVKVIAAGTVRIENSELYGFTGNGVEFAPSAAGAKLFVQNSAIRDNGGAGVLVDPPSGGGATASLSDDDIGGNGCGLVASSLGSSSPFSTNCGTPASGSGAAAGAASLTATNVTVDGNGTGVLINGGSATGAVGGAIVTGSSTGLAELNGGQLTSLGTVLLFGNGSDGAPTSTDSVFVGPPGPSGETGPEHQGSARIIPGTQTLAGVQCAARTGQVACNARLRTSAGVRDAAVALSRDGKVFAHGRLTHRTHLVWHARRRLLGRYVLSLFSSRKLFAFEVVTIGAPRA